MKNKHWHELVLPSFLLGATWLLVSAATTVYIFWADNFYQRVLTDNVASIRAGARMQHALWQLEYAKPEGEDLFREAFARAFDSASTPDEKQIVAAIDEEFKDFISLRSESSPVAATRSKELLNKIADNCERYRKLNVEIMEDRLAAYGKWFPLIGWVRLAAVIFGPIVGIWLGYRVARRFRDQIAAINVSLDGTSRELGEVQLTTLVRDGDLDDLNQQVLMVATRFQKMVTQLDDARRDATRNERLAAVGHLAAGVAHEIRNPLTAVKLLVQNAGQKAAGGVLNAGQLAVIREEISRMERTIQDLLDFAKPTSTQRVRHDLCETIRLAVRLVQGRADQNEIQIELANDEMPISTIGDPERLHQVFVNLLMNGMDAMSNGGRLSIEIRSPVSETSPLIPTPLRDGALDRMCDIVVRDDGSGIPPDLLNQIFEPFVTSKARGTGLGLAISRQIVEAHGGRLTAVNRIDGGAEFVISLPVEKSSPTLVGKKAVETR